MEYLYNHHYLFYAKILPLRCLSQTVGLSVLFANLPYTFNHLVSNSEETLFEFSVDKQH